MTPILRAEMLQPSELQALFGEEKDYSCSLTDIVHHTEQCEQQSDCENTTQGMCDFSTLSDPDCGQSCAVPHLQRQILSNQEYYTKLDELKREHIRNIAGLEKLYLNENTPDVKKRQFVSSRKERQLSNSKEHEEETESEQLELMQVGSKVSAIRPKSCISNLNLKQSRQNSFEELRKSCRSQQNSSPNASNQVKESTREAPDGLRQHSKITIPKPFHMMLREEERKRRNLKTRSEMELENERLRKELNELKECGKRFRARPAPTSTHMPLYDIIGKRLNKHQRQKNQSDLKDQGHHQRGIQHRAPPQKPFSFIERERKKREKKLADKINNLTAKEERKVFKAKPVPKYLYMPSSPNMYGADNLHTREQHIRKCSLLPPNILEDMQHEGEEAEKKYANEFSSSSFWKWKTKGILQVEEEMERQRNRERDWSYIHPLRRASFCHSQELSHTCKSDYISV
nr:protein FAM161A-like isoform X1 [Misgurnus anguillicaudatus]